MLEWLYYNKSTQNDAYTEEPSGQLDPERLLMNLPAFRNLSEMSQKQPVTLIIPINILPNNYSEELVITRCLLWQLQKQGHLIFLYSYAPQKLIAFDLKKMVNHQNNKSEKFLNYSVPDETKICELLDKEANEVVVVSDEMLEDLRDEYDSKWSFGKYEKIDLAYDLISQTMFEHIMHNSAEILKSLSITICPNIKSMPRNLHFPEMEELSIVMAENHSQLNVNHNLSSIYALIQECPKLKYVSLLPRIDGNDDYLKIEQMLKWSNKLTGIRMNLARESKENVQALFENFDEMKCLECEKLDTLDCSRFSRSSLSKIEILKLKNSTMESEFFSFMLNRMEFIRELYLENFKSNNNIKTIPVLPCLQSLTLTKTTLSMDLVARLLKQAPNLRRFIFNCEKIGGAVAEDELNLQDISLKDLETLELKYVIISYLGLLQILNSSPNLKTLILSSCIITRTTSIKNIQLKQLKQLNVFEVRHSIIDGELIGEIIKRAHNLSNLDLSYSSGLDSLTIEEINLNKLINLSLEECDITNESANKLYQASSQIECLKLHSYADEVLDALPILNLIDFYQLSLDEMDESRLSSILKRFKKVSNLWIFSILEELNLDNFIPLPSVRKVQFCSSNFLSLQLVNQFPNIEKIWISSHQSESRFSNLNYEIRPHLKVIDITDSNVNLHFLSLFLGACPSLEYLTLTDCSILENMENALPMLSKLKVLAIERAGKLSLSDLFKLLSSMPHLECLELRDTYFVWTDGVNLSLPEFKFLKEISLLNTNFPFNFREYIINISPNLIKYQGYKIFNNDKGGLSFIELDAAAIEKYRSIGEQAYIENISASKSRGTVGLKGDLISFPYNNTGLNSLPSCRDSTSIPMDLDTKLNVDAEFTIEQEFIGKKKNPRVSDVRQRVFNEVTINISSPSNLIRLAYSEKLSQISSAADVICDSNASLYKRYMGSDGNYFFGRFKLFVTSKWQNLSSISASEKLVAYYIVSGPNIIVQKRVGQSFYQVKLQDEDAAFEVCEIEVLYEVPENLLDEKSLPDDILEMVAHCQNFGDESINEALMAREHSEWLDALVELKQGACRHRAIAFWHMMQKKFPDVPVQIITNDVHAFAEVFFEGQWITCQLGGHPAKVNIKKNVLKEAAEVESNESEELIVQQQQMLSLLNQPSIDNKKQNPVRQDTLYFPKAPSATMHDILGLTTASVLIQNSDSAALRCGLIEVLQRYGRPFFYAGAPSELRCSGAYLKKDSDNVGRIRNGQSGPLVDFIKAHQGGVILINYDHFAGKDIAQYNSLYDDVRLVDGVELPASYQVIGLLNPNLPTSYQGGDFDSRFNDKKLIESVDAIPPKLQEQDYDALTITPDSCVIELHQSPDWQAKLLGFWKIDGNHFHYVEGELIKALKNPNGTEIIINNVPVANLEFQRFWQDFNLYKGAFYKGVMLAENAKNTNVTLAQHSHVKGLDEHFSLSGQEKLYGSKLVLNSMTYGKFLNNYKRNKKDKTLHQVDGFIARNHAKQIDVYVTQSLGLYQWMRLLEVAKLHQVKLHITLSPQVTLPQEIENNLSNANLVYAMLPTSSHTLAIFDEDWLHAVHDKDAMVIDISELKASDLLAKLNCNYQDSNNKLEFDEKRSPLLKALKNGKTVVLKGAWSSELAATLHPLLVERSLSNAPCGELILLHDNKELFPMMPEAIKNNVLHHQEKAFIQTKAEFDERFEKVEHVLKNSCFVLLSGPTGAGKTHFVQNDWQQRHPHCHYGESSIEKWARDRRLGIKTLFIDEANITNRQWSELEGLFNTPPALFINGKYIPLTSSHKVIFAGNPNNYGGERQLPSFFKHHQCEVEFKAIPLAPMIQKSHLNDENKKILGTVVDYLSQLQADTVLITPREVVMMIELIKTIQKNYPNLNETDVVRFVAYDVAKSHVPRSEQAEFDILFKPKDLLDIDLPKLSDLLITNSNKPAILSLQNHLDLRDLRLANTKGIEAKGGLGGVVLEGEPGIGKSAMAYKLLLSRGLIEGKDFVRISVSMSPKEKAELLLQAFHNGQIVIMDEINSAPMSERLLNALLEGHDLQSQPPRKPGFMLIGTQNPITFSGRLKTTLPLKHRLQTIQIPAYSEAEMLSILKSKGLPNQIANDILTEYQQEKIYRTELCFRHVLKACESWLERNPQAAVKNSKSLPPQLSGYKPTLFKPSSETLTTSREDIKPGF